MFYPGVMTAAAERQREDGGVGVCGRRGRNGGAGGGRGMDDGEGLHVAP